MAATKLPHSASYEFTERNSSEQLFELEEFDLLRDMPDEKKRATGKPQKREADEALKSGESEVRAEREVTKGNTFEQFENGSEAALHKHSTLAYLSGVEDGTPIGRIVPFSAITSSLRPAPRPDSDDIEYDEFGFLLESNDGNLTEDSSSTASGARRPSVFADDERNRLKWIAYLEFTHNDQVGELTFDRLATRLRRTERLETLVRSEGGIPHSLRAHVWPRLTNAAWRKRASRTPYREIVRAAQAQAAAGAGAEALVARQIEKDLLRTLPLNRCFASADAHGVARLGRVLRAVAWLYPEVGYCQGTGTIIAYLLLLLEEEDAFWLFASILEDLLPASYYNAALLGLQADQLLLRDYVRTYLPDLDRLLVEHDIELSLIVVQWFLTLFSSVVHPHVLMRIWDWFFLDGSIVLFRVALGMLKLRQAELLEVENAAQIFNVLSDIPLSITDFDVLRRAALAVDAMPIATLAVSVSESVTDRDRPQRSYSQSDSASASGSPVLRRKAGSDAEIDEHSDTAMLDASPQRSRATSECSTSPSTTRALLLTTDSMQRARRKYLARLLAEQHGAVPSGASTADKYSHLPKEQLTKRTVKRSVSIIDTLLLRSPGDSMRRTASSADAASTTEMLDALEWRVQAAVASSRDRDRLRRANSSSTSSETAIPSPSIFAFDSEKAKNVRQTELLIELREAIARIGRHFAAFDPRPGGIVQLVADYSPDSHRLDTERYMHAMRTRQRRAKALLDFERHDDDELGFKKRAMRQFHIDAIMDCCFACFDVNVTKLDGLTSCIRAIMNLVYVSHASSTRINDIITIISQKDEHCWVGELNGLTGWFPAKFVEVLDERSKDYSPAGDDQINEHITDLVRGSLATALQNVFEYGLKQSPFGGKTQVWHFIEQAATKQVEGEFSSVHSRLTLCKTFRLEDDGKVLTPEEVLYRTVQAINASHDPAKAGPEIKFRSLVCAALNEQALHLWFEVLCGARDTVRRWYSQASFVRSPCWLQLKCELRLLAQFAFTLQLNTELPNRPALENKQLKDGVCDMLIKHHLFSWDL